MLRAEGYDVTSYRNAREFLSQDSPSVFGLALLDFQMDGIDGIELQKELNRRQFPQPVIFLSAHVNLPIAVQAMKLGSFDFL
jgi:two-component system response regulator TtrR